MCRSKSPRWRAISVCINWQAVAIGALTLGIFYRWPLVHETDARQHRGGRASPRWRRTSPAGDVATIGTRFGGIPAGLPGLHFPLISLDAMRDLMVPAFTIAAARRDRIAALRDGGRRHDGYAP